VLVEVGNFDDIFSNFSNPPLFASTTGEGTAPNTAGVKK